MCKGIAKTHRTCKFLDVGTASIIHRHTLKVTHSDRNDCHVKHGQDLPLQQETSLFWGTWRKGDALQRLQAARHGGRHEPQVSLRQENSQFWGTWKKGNSLQRLQGMEAIVNRRCHCGKEIPSFGLPGGKATHCNSALPRLQGRLSVCQQYRAARQGQGGIYCKSGSASAVRAFSLSVTDCLLCGTADKTFVRALY